MAGDCLCGSPLPCWFPHPEGVTFVAVEIEREVVENYRVLRVERGLSWGQLAAQVGRLDPNLAAWFRSQAADEPPVKNPDDPEDVRDAPKPVRGPKRTAEQK